MKNIILILLIISSYHFSFGQCVGDCDNGWGSKSLGDGNSYEGQWSGGKKHGYGTLKIGAGAKYIGEFNYDDMQGYGVVYGNDGAYIQSGIYASNALSTSLPEQDVLNLLKSKEEKAKPSTNKSVCLSGDCQNGFGKNKDADGNIYEGTWKNSKMHGKGTLLIASGAKYIGEFDNDNMQGWGVVYGNDGAYLQSGIYKASALETSKPESEVLAHLEGTEKKTEKTEADVCVSGNCVNGSGKMVYADGNVYDGTWKNGKWEGRCVLILADGTKYIGEFVADAMSGYGVVYRGDGSIAQSGIYANNALVTAKTEKEVYAYLDQAYFTSDIATAPITKMSRPDAVAVVIGNKDYTKTKTVDFALNDASLVKKYLMTTMGFREGNIFYIENATKDDFETFFGVKGNHKGKLFNTVKAGVSEVFVFYSGHGAPSLKDHKGYFVPVTCDPQYVELGGYPTEVFYENLAMIPSINTTVVLDACFSGATVFNNISPIVIKSEQTSTASFKGTVLSSSSNEEVSSWYNEKQQGMFTYFFLKAINNKNADLNKDNKLTLEEIHQYAANTNDGVPYYARRVHGVEQTPGLTGNNAKSIIVEY